MHAVFLSYSGFMLADPHDEFTSLVFEGFHLHFDLCIRQYSIISEISREAKKSHDNLLHNRIWPKMGKITERCQ